MPQHDNYLINDCLIEPKLNRISRSGLTQTIEPRVMDVLLVLIENQGNVCYRENIIQQVWKNRVVSDSSLNRNIGELRKILDSDKQQASCIKTVPKKGYLLQAQVHLHTQATEDSAMKTASTKSKPGQNSSQNSSTSFWNSVYWPISLAILGLLLIISLLLFLSYSSNSEQTPISQSLLKSSTHQYQLKHNVSLLPDEQHKAFCLDGVDDYIEVDHHPTIDISDGDFSVTAWIKTTNRDVVTIVDKRNESENDGVRGFSLYLADGTVGFQLADGGGRSATCASNTRQSSCSNFDTKAFVADDKWHLLSVTIDRDIDTGLSFFVDGQLIRQTNPTTRQGSLSTQKPLRIGSRSSSVSSLFVGHIGEVTIFNTVLSAAQIKQQYLNGHSRNCQHSG